MKLLLNQQYELYEWNGQAFCDSLKVAEEFGKRHDHVLRDTENVLDTISKTNLPKFGEINFQLSSYKDARGRKQPRYLYTKDGFAYLTFGFEGEKAAELKIAYITRFNQMEAFINERLASTNEVHPALMDAIKEAHAEPKPYHYSNEINMIYRIVLGMDAKKYRQQNNLPAGTGIKPHLTVEQITAIEALQRIDVGLHEAGLSYEERKGKLTERYHKQNKKHLLSIRPKISASVL